MTTTSENNKQTPESPSYLRKGKMPWKGQNLSQKHMVERLLRLSTFYIQGC